MTYQSLDLHIADHVAHLQLNRPQALNAMNKDFWREFPQAIDAISQDESVRVVVLSSTGKHFSAGLDIALLSELIGQSRDDEAHRRKQFMETVLLAQETFSALEMLRVPVLAAVQGGCLGGGLDMIVACDMRYCTEDAFFCIAEIDQGLTADVGSLQRLPHLMPQGLVRELAYTGWGLPAQEALRYGLVNAVYPTHESLLTAVNQIAATIASKSPMAILGSKEMLNYARDHSVADALNHVATWNAGLIFSNDLTESVQARLGKRQPVYHNIPVPLRSAFG